MITPKHFNKGDRYGGLTATGNHKRIVYEGGSSEYLEEMICDCGNKKFFYKSLIKAGKQVDCGCKWRDNLRDMHTTHGLSRTRIHQIRSDMKHRCFNQNNRHYNSYGGRGISVCKERAEDFMNFYSDMSETYNEFSEIHGEKNTTLDRIDVNGNYCKENCRWATKQEQQSNRQGSVLYERKGKMLTAPQIYNLEKPNLTLSCFKTRMHNWKDPVRALGII